MATNVPVSVWRDTDGLSEYTNEGAYYIDDTAGFYLTDPSGFYIVDTGVIATLIPDTVWEEDDSL